MTCLPVELAPLGVGGSEESIARERFKERGTGSFFGGHLDERAVPAHHFLRQLERVVHWRAFEPRLIRAYRYDLSEHQMQQYANDSLSVKRFLGLTVDEADPDHNTLARLPAPVDLLPPALQLSRHLVVQRRWLAQWGWLAQRNWAVFQSQPATCNWPSSLRRHKSAIRDSKLEMPFKLVALPALAQGQEARLLNYLEVTPAGVSSLISLGPALEATRKACDNGFR